MAAAVKSNNAEVKAIPTVDPSQFTNLYLGGAYIAAGEKAVAFTRLKRTGG
jgi:hypothetical protein